MEHDLIGDGDMVIDVIHYWYIPPSILVRIRLGIHTPHIPLPGSGVSSRSYKEGEPALPQAAHAALIEVLGLYNYFLEDHSIDECIFNL